MLDTLANPQVERASGGPSLEIPKLHVSAHSRIRLVVFIGTYGAGKDTMIKALRKLNSGFRRMPSHTSRPPGTEEEKRGETDYIFHTLPDLMQMDRDGKLAWCVNPDGLPDWYGTAWDDLREVLHRKEGLPALMQIEYPSLVRLLANPIAQDAPPGSIVSFLMMVKDENILRQRLLNRARAGDDIEGRLVHARTYNKEALAACPTVIPIDNSFEKLDKPLSQIANILVRDPLYV